MIHLHLSSTGVLRRAGSDSAPLAPRDALLLAWLALEGPTRRARLATLLWPDAEESRARASLRQRVFQLRRRFGAELLADDALVALGQHVTHNLDDAHGVLDGVALDLGAELSEWISAQRSARLNAAIHRLSEAADHAEKARDWGHGAGVKRRSSSPLRRWRRTRTGRLIRLHYLSGDRAAALVAFDRCEATLKHEVGTAPSAETLALLRLVTVSGSPQPLTVMAPAVALQRPPRAVGRDAAQAALMRAVDEGRLALVIGDAGIGKSRVLADAADRCRAEGRTVLHVRARPGDALLPNALAARWLEALLALPGVEPASDVRAELARLLPTLGAPPREQDGRGERLRRALASVLRQAIDGGLQAVVVDDLHHADDASLALLLPLAEDGDTAGCWECVETN